MPAGADVQTGNARYAGPGHKNGKAEQLDSVTFTFASVVTPSLVLRGWTGSPTTVTVHFQDNKKNDILSVKSGAWTIAALGSVGLGGDYSDNVDFTNSTMAANGKTITIWLGKATGKVKDKPRAGTMVWTPPTNTVSESGPLDKEF
jgi:hypothetical protein